MSKTIELPGQKALIDRSELPEGAIVETHHTTYLTWESDAVWKVVEFGCRPDVDDFQIFESQAPMEIPDPPNPRSDWGQCARNMHDWGLLEQVAPTRAARKTCRKSLLWRWRVTPEAQAKYLARVAEAAAGLSVAA